MKDAHCMPNPWVSLRCDPLIPVNKGVNKKEQLEKGLEEEEEEKTVKERKGVSVQPTQDLYLGEAAEKKQNATSDCYVLPS
jgi:hypothetical protein